MKIEKKILIIDDEQPHRKAMTLSLEREGYTQIFSCATGEEGIEAVKSFKPDIIVIDVVLPGRDGFDICRELRSMKELKSKIIMITGHLDAVNADKARISGADELIEKTSDFEEVGRMIHGVIDRLAW